MLRKRGDALKIAMVVGVGKDEDENKSEDDALLSNFWGGCQDQKNVLPSLMKKKKVLK